MKNSTIRLSEISIQNFKNIKNGELNFNNRRKKYRASILGLYGQNGSGKTALIDALQLLKYILCGKTVPADMADCINVDAEYAALSYKFDVTISTGRYEAFYEFRIRKEKNITEQNLDMDAVHEHRSKLMIYDEVLSYSFDGNQEKIRKGPFIDTRTEKVFVPVSKYDCLLGKDKDKMMNLLAAKIGNIVRDSPCSISFPHVIMHYIC